MGRLKGKTALITGSARGIGKAIALRFAMEGANLVMCDLNMESLADVADEAKARGIETHIEKTDVSSREQVQILISKGIEQFGMIDIVVNNAGIFFNAPFEETTDEQFDRIMSINVKSVFLVSQTIIREWLKHDVKGSIVNLASISASVAFVDSSAYCTTKAAVASMTRCIALEYGPKGIRANSMAPGIIDTAMLPSQEDNNEWANNKLPLRRLGTPEDVADVALFLASDESRYVTGDMIYVDGGWMLN